MVTAQEESRSPSLVERYPYLGLILAIGLIAGAVWLLDGGKLGDVASDSTAVALTGGQSGSTPKIGEPAPDFTLEGLDGGPISLSQLRGRPVLINFWATWCPPCRGEMPDLQNLSQEHQGAGLVVLAINLQEEGSVVQRYADTLSLSFPIALDRNAAVANRYNLTALPTSYFIDRDGVVRDLNVGALTAKGLRSKVAKMTS